MTKRLWSWVFLFAALVLTLASVWQARHQWTVLSQWKSATGTLVRRDVPLNHDPDGYLYFQMKGTFRYAVDGKERESSASSHFGSSDFGWLAARALAYNPGSQYPIRYDPARPEVFEFGAGYNALYFRTPLQYLWAAAVCLLLGLLLLHFSQGPKHCAQCNRTVRSFFRYCPDCGESISLA